MMYTIAGANVSLTDLTGTSARVRFVIPADAPTGLYSVSVQQWALGVPHSDTLYDAFTVVRRPTITAVDPANATAGSGDLKVTVTGVNFIRIYAPLPQASVLQVNGTTVATTFESSTKLTATVPASMLTAVGVLQLVVVNTGTPYDPEVQRCPLPIPGEGADGADDRVHLPHVRVGRQRQDGHRAHGHRAPTSWARPG